MHPPQRLHRYTMTHGGRQIIILAANDWAAIDHQEVPRTSTDWHGTCDCWQLGCVNSVSAHV